MNPFLMGLLLAAALAALAYTLVQRIRLLARLQGEWRLDRLRERVGLLFRVGVGQSRLIGRQHERSAGAMHAFIFWGALIIGLREVIAIGEGFVHGFQAYVPLLGPDSFGAYLWAFVYTTTEVVVLAMLVWALWRRIFVRPARLDLNAEGVVVLLFIMGIVATDLMFDAGRFNMATVYGHEVAFMTHPVFGSEAVWAPFPRLLAVAVAPWGEAVSAFLYEFGFWGHMVVALVFLNVLPYTKQFHEITALPNVFLGSVGYPHRRIRLLDLEDEEAFEAGGLGVDRVEHLTWKEGLDLYTCTECGRCYDICPTYVTGKPLTMKWVNDDLRHHLEAEAPRIRSTGASSASTALVGDVIRQDTLWACTTCRACEEVCPVSIEHVPRIIAMRQAQALLHDAFPEELNPTFRGLEQNGNPWNIGYDKRADWAAELDFEVPVLTEPPGEDVDVVLWVGCMGAFDKRSQRIAQATAQLLRAAGVRFAMLGTAEKCTGDLARRAGNELLYQTLARENVETLNGLGVKQVVTQCPHCLNSLKQEYPQLDGHYEVHHHSQYIARLVEEGRLQLRGGLEGGLTYHDPCYLGRYEGEYDAPRALLGQAAAEPLREMRRSGPESFCCGAGGARMWIEERQGLRVNEERVRQAEETGAGTIATACPFCMTMVSDGVNARGQEDNVQVLDVAEVVLQNLQR